MKVYGALENAQIEWFTEATLPTAATYPYRVVQTTDTKKVYISDGTSWNQVGSKAGTKNYFSQSNINPDFEGGFITPWSAFTTTYGSDSVPTTLTFTASQVTLSTTSTNPLVGTYSGQFVKSAANAQGQGICSGVMTIDREDRAKVLTGSFYYEVVSGSADFSGTSTQSLEIWLYDVTNSAWVQPAGYRGMNQSSGQGRVSFTFQSASNASQYRVAILLRQTDTTAVTVNFDDFSVGPQTAPIGAVITDWVAYTPTFTGFGTVSTQSCFFRRVGDSIEVRGTFTSGTSTATEARVSIPYTSASSIATLELAGKWDNNVSSATFFSSGTILCEPSVGYITFGAETSALNGVTKQNANAFAASGNTFKFYFKLPISGFSSNVQVSNDTDTRVVALVVTGSAATATGGNPIIFPTVTKDSHGNYNSSTGRYTVPVSGFYQVSTGFRAASGSLSSLYCYINGAIAGTIGLKNSTDGGGTGAGTFFCNSGDILDIRPLTNSVSAMASDSNFSIFRLTGPSVIAATELVACAYGLTTSQAVALNAVLKLDTKIVDTHSAYSTSTGLFTAPVSGTYEISGSFNMSATGGTYIKKNSTAVAYLGTASANVYASGSYLVSLVAGDTVGLYTDSASTYAATTGNGYVNKLNIKRLGN
jgi:hypothetical protein